MYMGSTQKIDNNNDVFVELYFIDDTKQAYRVYKFE